MPSIQSRLDVKDGAITLSVTFRLWGSQEGSSLLLLDPRDADSRTFLSNERATIKQVIAAKYGRQAQNMRVFDLVPDNMCSPDNDSKSFTNGQRIPLQRLIEFGEALSKTKAPDIGRN